jgi:hypothetical protein
LSIAVSCRRTVAVAGPDGVYLGMRPGDLEGKPLARYWNPEMAPLAGPVREALVHGPEAAELGLPLDEANRLLEPGDLPIENGWTRLANGHLFVAVRTPMPGVTPAMIDWWFAWHGVEAQRYKLWHPRAHLHARMERALAGAPGLGDREKYVGNVSFVTEYVGDRLLELSIVFRDPSHYFDTARFGAARVGTAVCARVGFATWPLDTAHLIHLVQETEDGCAMRSRFWLGDLQARSLGPAHVLNRHLLQRGVIARVGIPSSAGRDLLVHCAKEMAHLATFLPALYRDHHPAA